MSCFGKCFSAMLIIAASLYLSGCAQVTAHSTQRPSLMTPNVSFQMSYRAFVAGDIEVIGLPEGQTEVELLWSERDIIYFDSFRHYDSTGSGTVNEDGAYMMTADIGYEYTLQGVSVGKPDASETGDTVEVLPLKTYAFTYAPVEMIPFWKEFISHNPKEKDMHRGGINIIPFIKKGHIIDIGCIKVQYDKKEADAGQTPFRVFEVKYDNQELKEYMSKVGLEEDWNKGKVRVIRVNVLTGEQSEVDPASLN